MQQMERIMKETYRAGIGRKIECVCVCVSVRRERKKKKCYTNVLIENNSCCTIYINPWKNILEGSVLILLDWVSAVAKLR